MYQLWSNDIVKYNNCKSICRKNNTIIILLYFRQVFCWIDKWHGLTMEDIRALEDKTKDELDKQRQLGEVRGMRGDDE